MWEENSSWSCVTALISVDDNATEFFSKPVLISRQIGALRVVNTIFMPYDMFGLSREGVREKVSHHLVKPIEGISEA